MTVHTWQSRVNQQVNSSQSDRTQIQLAYQFDHCPFQTEHWYAICLLQHMTIWPFLGPIQISNPWSSANFHIQPVSQPVVVWPFPRRLQIVQHWHSDNCRDVLNNLSTNSSTTTAPGIPYPEHYTLPDLSGLECFCIHNSSQSVTGCCTYISLARHHIKHQTCLHALAIRIKPQNLETMLLHTPVPIEPCSKTFSLLHLCKADPHPNAWVLHETVPHQLYQHPVSTVAVCYTFLWHTCPTGNKLVVKFSRIFIPFKFNKLS